jgi:hypothetical protein
MILCQITSGTMHQWKIFFNDADILEANKDKLFELFKDIYNSDNTINDWEAVEIATRKLLKENERL